MDVRWSLPLAFAILSGCGSPSAVDVTDAAVVDSSIDAAIDSSATDVRPDVPPDFSKDGYSEVTAGLACANIVGACHDADPGVGPIHDCHEIGHNGTLADCEKREIECIAICMGTADASPDTHD